MMLFIRREDVRLHPLVKKPAERITVVLVQCHCVSRKWRSTLRRSTVKAAVSKLKQSSYRKQRMKMNPGSNGAPHRSQQGPDASLGVAAHLFPDFM